MDGTGRVLVPKGPRVEGVNGTDRAPFDRDAMLEQLFALPLPPAPTNTRTYPTDTPLGRIMRLRGLTVNEVARCEGGPNARQLTDILSGARELGWDWKQSLARGLGIDWRLL